MLQFSHYSSFPWTSNVPLSQAAAALGVSSFLLEYIQITSCDLMSTSSERNESVLGVATPACTSALVNKLF